MSKRKLKREQQKYLSEAASQLVDVRNGIERAYNVFNNTADPDLLEASILEMHALESKYSCLLRNLKTINGETRHALSSHPHSQRSPRSGAGTHRNIADAAEQAY